jgi:hypothetical protein
MRRVLKEKLQKSLGIFVDGVEEIEVKTSKVELMLSFVEKWRAFFSEKSGKNCLFRISSSLEVPE